MLEHPRPSNSLIEGGLVLTKKGITYLNPNHKRLFLPFILSALVLGSIVLAGVPYQVRAVSTGVVCLDVSSSTSCPSSAPTLSGPLNSTIVVAVNIQGSEALNGFDITVKTTDSVLKGTSISTDSSVLGTSPFVVSNCVDGHGSGCEAGDGPGTARLAAIMLGGLTSSPVTGRLFSITYVIVGNSTGTTIGFLSGCSGTTSVAGFCVTVVDPSLVPETIQTAFFSNIPSTPDFSISANPASMNVSPSNSTSSTITVTSLSEFSGDVFLNASFSSFTGNVTLGPHGVEERLTPSSVTLLPGGSQNSTFVVTALANATLGTYTFSIEGSSGSLSHVITVEVRVGTASVLGFPFHDDFNYASLDQLFAAGWFVCSNGPPSFYSVGGGVVTLTDDGNSGGAICLNAPPMLNDWSFSTRVSWTGGSVGSIQLVVFTKSHEYFWQADGYYSRFHLQRDATDAFSINGYQPQLNAFHDLRLDAQNGLLSAYFDGRLIGTYQEPDPTTAVAFDLGSSWNAVNAYDSASGSFSPALPRDFAMSANPSSLTIQAGTSGTSTITVTSLRGFVGNVALASQVLPSFGPTSSLSPSTVSLSPNGTALATLSISSSTFGLIGPFNVTVTGSSGTMTHSISVNVIITPPPPQPPDFGIDVFPQSIVLIDGGSSTAAVSVFDVQGFTGTVQLSSIVVPSLVNGPSISLNPSSVFISPSQGSGNALLTVSTTPNTTDGNFTITITGTSGSLTHAATAQLVILPPPTLSVSPFSGTLGTQVLVQGHGFPTLPGLIGISPILVSFDDMFLGFGIPKQGSFNFTFDIPHAQAGLHHIKAEDEVTGATATADFQVTSPPPTVTLAISIDTGPIYFPGDNATIYVLVTGNGAAMTPSSIQLTLYFPNGTASALAPSSISPGFFRVTFVVPKKGPIGSYALVATASMSNAQGAALTTFEVKPAWVSPGGPTVLGALGLPDAMPSVAVVGMVIAGIAVLGLAFLTRKTSR